jgi:carboxymethylenebutenolidase
MRLTLPSGTIVEVARPTGPARRGIVVSADIFGLRQLYDDLCARLADEYEAVVVCPDPFPGLDLGPTIEPRFAAVPQRSDERALGDLLEAADLALADIGSVDVVADSEAVDSVGSDLAEAVPGEVSLIGFCLGGMYCHKAAPLGRFHRIVSFYGMIRLPDAWRSPVQGEPLDALAAGGAASVLAIIGERDTYTPADAVEALVAAGVEVVRYPEAEHGFVHDASRPAHRADDAADAWARCRAWIDS